MEKTGKGKNVPHEMLRYFPLKSGLRRVRGIHQHQIGKSTEDGRQINKKYWQPQFQRVVTDNKSKRPNCGRFDQIIDDHLWSLVSTNTFFGLIAFNDQLPLVILAKFF